MSPRRCCAECVKHSQWLLTYIYPDFPRASFLDWLEPAPPQSSRSRSTAAGTKLAPGSRACWGLIRRNALHPSVDDIGISLVLIEYAHHLEAAATMLDENLPSTSGDSLSAKPRDANTLAVAFFLDAAKDNVAHHKMFYLTRGGSEPDSAYRLDTADPTLAASKNVYSVGLFDPYNPDVLYGEVLVRPEWSQPSLSQEDIRRNGGIPPPPEPLMPEQFTIQLYNPDQQITVRYRTSSIVGTPRWEFSMPQHTFRLPSGSQLDRSQNDPAADSNTPQVNFVWKKESSLRKDIHCYMVGKSTDVVHKKRSKEADITVALFRSLREITLYEPNLYRVEMEDPKGLEVVLLLGAATIRDIWFGNFKQAFNYSEASRRKSSATLENRPDPNVLQRQGRAATTTGAPPGHAALGGLYQSSQVHLNAPSRPPARSPNRPPPMDPRTHWEVESETARLRAQVEAEEREERRREDARRREQARLDEEETKRLRRMVEDEEKARLKHDKAVEKETKRLQKLYGNQTVGRPVPPPPSAAAPQFASGALPAGPTGSQAGPQSRYPQYPVPQATGPSPPPRTSHDNSPYLQPGGPAGQGSSSNSRLNTLGGSVLDLAERYKLNKKKSSAF